MESKLVVQVQTIKHALIKIKPSSLLTVTDTVKSKSAAKRLITCGKVHIINNDILSPIFNDKEIQIYPNMEIQCGRKKIKLEFESMSININAVET